MLKAYTSKFSYFTNEEINMKINSTDNVQSIKIYKFYDLEIVYNDNIDKNFLQNDNISNLPFIEGYNWNVNYIIKINKLIPGLYFIEIKNVNNNLYYLPINIKNHPNLYSSDQNDKRIKNIVLLNSNTWNAYNEYGGASFYRYNLPFKSKYGVGSIESKYPNPDTIGCTFDRPFDNLSNGISFYIKNNGIIKEKYNHLLYGELRLLQFMKLNNIKYDLLDDIDLHTNSIDISKYENFILNCHPEYWSIEMNNNINKNANNIISFAGNVSYRKITYENNKIYKRGLHLKEKLINITGSYYSTPGVNTYAPYKIYKPDNELFNLIDNQYIGVSNLNINPYKKETENGTSGHETDKNINRNEDEILAKGENPNNGGGDILFFQITKNENLDKRTILSVGSIVFTGGIFIDENTEIFIKNVFIHFNM